jgi:ubiquinone/menaquinone biosynthesis C-methylase UbiE
MDIVNVEMAKAWDEEGKDWARDWRRFDRAIHAYQEALLVAADLKPNETVLDIGCGNGESARLAAMAVYPAQVVGVDLSNSMLERARALAEEQGVTNVEFEQGDAQVHPFDEGAYDVAISRFGAMFFGDRVAAFSNIARALKPGAERMGAQVPRRFRARS